MVSVRNIKVAIFFVTLSPHYEENLFWEGDKFSEGKYILDFHLFLLEGDSLHLSVAIQYQEAEKRSGSKTIVDMSVNDTHVAAMLLASEEQGQERGLILVWSLGSSVAPWRLECSGGGIPRSI